MKNKFSVVVTIFFSIDFTVYMLGLTFSRNGSPVQDKSIP